MNTTRTAKLDAAETILAQLGGNAFIAMTGARTFLGCENGLQFKIPAAPKNNATAIRVTLDDTDTYTMTFYKIRGLNVKDLGSVSDIQCSDLCRVFTEHTGLYTSL